MMDAITKRKLALKASSEQHKRAISNDLKILANKTDKITKNTLLTTVVLLSALALYKLLKDKEGKKSSKQPNRVFTMVKHQIGLYVLNQGKSKLVDYINSLDDTDE